MFIPVFLPDGSKGTVVTPHDREEALASRFSPTVPLAGTLFGWVGIDLMLGDLMVRGPLVAAAGTAIAASGDKANGKSHVICLSLERQIGWSLMGERQNFRPRQIRYIRYKSRVRALCVNSQAKHLVAPKTNLLNITYSWSFNRQHGWKVFVTDIYPGPTIPDGDDIRESGLIFFCHGHPGEP